ncbi:putative DNA topoisomerase (ATP-hydrolyzing) [Helianthus annuus]|uniref:DNA topoisomerase 2 n=1 Tax=Helianthus annuus TaxID=4232 RepID=A0A251VP40_HELAN|nr:DNA topoisomerase 2 [Helianthus annuus]KAF5822370.1 putative DNA topoisomerase (ATP-hydrolyzing) [Helianthus annuus]KAJ0627209.1 putative DNA topoisomerase (ATP-hydrolyzing) [Helianthus annuus]
MATDHREPLHSTTTDNIPPTTKPTKKAARTIEETYQKKTQLEHILLRPDTYIGSIEKHEQTLWVWENDQMVKRPISYVPGLYKIFDEILVNAADNKQRDPKMDSVKVNIDVGNNLISVYNNGDGIPVEIHQEEKVYVPELIFGHLLTSSNYDDSIKKTTGGRNGYGAKLANIFSTEFTIETADGKRNRRYKQVFTNNMGKKLEPTITKCKNSENWTMVSFKPDLSKFGMECLEDDVVALMKKRVVDLAGCLGKSVKVELDGKRVPPKTFEDYVKLYLQPSTDTLRIYEKVNERWEICVSIADGHFEQVSFVNNIATIKGGTHVDYITNQIANHLVTVVKKQNKHANLKAHNVKNYLWVFVNALIDNPAFDSQTKETLTIKQSSFGSTCELSPEFLKKVAKSDIVKRVVSWVQFKQQNDLKKTDGNKRGKLNIPKLEEANFAATNNSDNCTLILTEGDSAKALAMSGLSVVGQDYYGVFPLRGKLLNVREASPKQLQENAEIQNIKKILGLQHGKIYDNVKSLRYGHLMIMADQDHDGSHIKGLLINFLHSFWPSLLKVPEFVLEFITPIVKATNKKTKNVISFYTMPEYEAWKENLGHKAREYKIKYYKGLGTSNGKEGAEYFADLEKHKKDFVWADDEDGDAIELAFSKKKIEARKNWLRALQAGTFFDSKEKHIPYRDFINKELILFSMADLQRSIPSMVDGLKPGQRKILFCAFKKPIFQEVKVAQFSGYVSEHSAYHHGEQSLVSTIIGMAQNFIGSNNINLFYPSGQFGTRQMGGKDHASGRYIYTKLSPITRHLFHKADELLLNYLNEDGQSIEPTWFIPIIPMVLVNGSEGIGTGWSSFIPNYNPRDIIANLKRLLNGEQMVPMDPWYKWFKGTIQKTTSKDTGYTTVGVFEENEDNNSLNITELPIRRWTQEYKEFLEAASLSGKDKEPFIEEYNAHNDDTTVHFEVVMTANQMNKAKEEGLLKKFKLTTTLSTSNMHLFDANGVIKKYDTPEQILEDFFHLRLDYYEKRKNALLHELGKASLQLENKVRFIREVVEGTLVVSNRKKADLCAELKVKGYTPLPKEAVLEASIAGAVDHVEGSEETEEGSEEETAEMAVEEQKPSAGTASKTIPGTEYDYLLSMAIGTLTYEKMQQLWHERDTKKAEFDELTNTPSKSLWLRDLDSLNNQLDEQDKRDAKDEAERRKQQEKARAKGPGGGRNARKPARKAVTKKPSATSAVVIEPMDTSANDVPVPKPRGKAAGQKKAPAKGKGKATLVDEDDDEIPSLAERMAQQNLHSVQDGEIVELEDRLAKHNIESSPDQEEVPKKKAPAKRPAAAKKKATTIISDDENEEDIDLSDDSDFEVLVAPPEEKKKGGRKPAAAKPPAAAATKKRGAAAGAAAKTSKQTGGQKLITEVLKPVVEASPEKKVRKMRPSPFNKKSGSVLNKKGEEEKEEDEMVVGESSGEVGAKARPQRANRKKMTYVISDSEEEDEEVDDEASEDSDFDDDE